MDHVITTYGGGELFVLVFNGIAALFKTNHTGLVMPLIRIGLMVGSVYMLILMLARSSLEEGLKWLLWVIIATNLLFLPKTTIWIHDPLTNTRAKVDHVPFALGAFASLVSQVGRGITEQMESVFTLPDYMPYHQTGTVFASSLMSQMGQFRIVDPEFKGNMERFVNQCVVYDAMIGHKYTLVDLQNTADIWTLVRTQASPVLGFLYKAAHNPGTIVTCREGAESLANLWNAEIDKATAIYGSRVQNQNLTKAAFFTNLGQSYQLMTSIAEDASKLLKQEMMINVIEDASNNKLSELGAPSNYAATRALLQQRTAYAVAGEIAARTLPLFKNVIEALSYGLFIFIVVLALLPNGYKVLMTYFGILVWTQLWAPLYAILNLIMTLYGRSETTSLMANSGLTLLNSSAVINANADMVTLAAWLSVSIPFISYGILKQGAGAFVGLAQHLGSAMQSAASGAASETVSGNISLGNVSMGTQAYQNTSAFQHTASPSYNASQFKSMSPSGIESNTFASGAQAFNDQAMSHLSVQIMGTENTSYAEQQNLNNALTGSQTKSLSASEATESALQTSTNFISRLGTEQFKGEDYTKNTSASEAKSLQNFNNFVKEIQQRQGLDETQAVEAALGVGLGGGIAFLDVGAKGSFSSSAARQKAIQNASSIADQIGYSESTEKIVSAAKSLSEGTHHIKASDLDNSALASLNQAKGLREEAAIAQSKVETLSKDISSNQSKGITINKELTQEVLEFIAHHPANPGIKNLSGGHIDRGQIGYKEARRIFEGGGEERASYLKRFQEQNPQYSIQSINVDGAESALNTQYEAQTQQQRNSAGIQTQNSSNIQGVQSQAQAAGLTQSPLDQQNKENTQNNDSVKKAVLDQIKDTGAKIDKGSGDIAQEKQILQDAEKASQEKTLLVTAGKDLFNSMVDGFSSVGKDITDAVQKLPPDSLNIP
jgi:conjugal transfer mating pair stabilization protein TraG